MNIEERLRDLSDRIESAEREAGIAGEQLAFQTDVAEEAKVRALVSETPLADRQAREARDDLNRTRRHYEKQLGYVDELRREQDRLLERLLQRR